MRFLLKTWMTRLHRLLFSWEITSDQLEYEVLDKGSTGFLGIGSKNAVIKARKKFSIDENVV